MRYLIIAGAPKAGTTSLFDHLEGHPEISACLVKEPGFFMDPDAVTEPPVAGLAAEVGELAPYERLFKGGGGHARMEATVGYMYSNGTPLRLHDALPDVRLVFVLRHPVDRIISAYFYQRQEHEDATAMTFRQFLDHQAPDFSAPRRRQLAEGRYAELLARYFEVFPSKQIHLIVFKDPAEQPRAVVQGAGLPASIRAFSRHASLAPTTSPRPTRMPPSTASTGGW